MCLKRTKKQKEAELGSFKKSFRSAKLVIESGPNKKLTNLLNIEPNLGEVKKLK